MGQMTQAEALEVIEAGNAALTPLFARLTDEQAQQPRTIGGGEWSAKDLLGHIAFWEEFAIEAVEAWRAGRRPQAEQIFGAEDVDAANARNFERTAAQSIDEVRARAARSHAAIVTLVREMTQDEWASKAPYETERRRTLGEMIGSIMGAPKGPFAHALAHEADLRAAADAFA